MENTVGASIDFVLKNYRQLATRAWALMEKNAVPLSVRDLPTEKDFFTKVKPMAVKSILPAHRADAEHFSHLLTTITGRAGWRHYNTLLDKNYGYETFYYSIRAEGDKPAATAGVCLDRPFETVTVRFYGENGEVKE